MPSVVPTATPPRATSDPALRIPRAWWWIAFTLILVRAALLAVTALPMGTLIGDESTNVDIAQGLLAGHGAMHEGQPWVLRPPGWPVVLAALMALPTPDRPTVAVFQGLCDGATALLWAWIALLVYRRRGTAAFAFLAVLAWPPFLRESRFMQTDPLYTALLAFTCLRALRLVQRPTIRKAALLGFAAGLATLVRPPGLLFTGALLAAWFAWRPRRLIGHVAAPVTACLVVALMLAPWTIRNALLFHRFVPVSVGSGEMFFQGALLETEGEFKLKVTGARADTLLAHASLRAGHALSPFERDKVLMDAGLGQWRQDPAHSAWLVLVRAGRLCLLPLDGADRPLLRMGFLALLLALYALAIPRMIGAWSQDDPARAFPGVLGVALLLAVLAHLPFFTSSRYFEPMRPVLIVLAIATLTTPRALRPVSAGRTAPPRK